MKKDTIESYELFETKPRWLFIRIQTSNGIVGWGEASLEGLGEASAGTVKDLMTTLIGRDPAQIQKNWQTLTKTRFYGATGGPVFMSALAGIDQALWDIKGKTLGVPVHELLGGAVRNKLKMYRWCGGNENSPEETAREASEVLASSHFTCLKMNACPRMSYVDTEQMVQAAADRMSAVREAVGPKIGIGLDFHGRCKFPEAKRLIKALEPYNPLFFEEPVAPHANDFLLQLANSTHIPIATGERMYTYKDFASLISTGAVQIIQPDLSHAGGISHVFDIARLAEHYDVAFAPHCPLGPIALASCLQVDFCAINAVFQESSIGIHYNQEGGGDLLDYLSNKEDFEIDQDGYIKCPEKPGLGVEINEEFLREVAAEGHDWKDPVWELEDGSPTKW